MNYFAFSKILLRYFKFRFHLEFPYFFNTQCTFWPNSILFLSLENRFWNSILFKYFQYHVGTLNISANYCARKLFKPSKELASLHVSYENKNFFFCEWRHKCKCFRPIWPTSSGSRPKPLSGSIWLKFLLETRLKFEFFDTLIDLLNQWFLTFFVSFTLSQNQKIDITPNDVWCVKPYPTLR